MNNSQTDLESNLLVLEGPPIKSVYATSTLKEEHDFIIVQHIINNQENINYS
jgi:hypothetical protein